MTIEFRTQYDLNFDGKINVDLFAGGGGASTGIEMGTGRPVHVAINHDPDAISMHKANHPNAEHYECDIFEVDPVAACRGRAVGHLHASPDCTHHSQASGGQPRKKAIRSLSWVVHRWAGKGRPDVITMENVAQILQWSPLIAKRCSKTGRVVKLNGTIALPGERVPVNEQYLIPNKKKRGHNWQHFIDGLRTLGYAVEWRTMKACEYGAPTTRERLYLVARCDGKPIVWPTPTHAQKPKRGQRKWRTAADCIDWTIPGQSIFNRKRPLAAATMRRIATGFKKYVLEASEPYILTLYGDKSSVGNFRGHYSLNEPLRTQTTENRFGVVNATLAPFLTEHANSSNQRNMRADEPMRTITGHPKGGSFALATAHLAHLRGNCDARPVDEPLRTISAGGEHHGFVAATLIHAGHGEQSRNGEKRWSDGTRDILEPLNTITASGSPAALVTAFLARQFSASVGQKADAPAPTVTAGGAGKTAVVECHLSPKHEAGALQVAGFLMQYYSEGGQWSALDQPTNTITTKDRLALVTVWIKGAPYVIVDICLRMLSPRELYRAQGFPDSYIIETGHDGRAFPKYKQVRFVGNSVSPLPMAAIARANLITEWATKKEAA